MDGAAVIRAVNAREPAPPPANVAGARSVSVVIPAYNEERRLARTLRGVEAFLRSGPYDAEVIVVDDGSRDATTAVAESVRREMRSLRVITNARNSGKGFAVRTGILAAARPAVLFMDADLATPMEELDRLWGRYERGYDVVIASRRTRDARVRVIQPAYRRLMGRVFGTLVSTLGVRGFQDTQCGFKLFRTSVARRLFGSLRTKGFAFDVEVLLRAKRAGARIAEIGVDWTDMPGSRINPIRDSLVMVGEVLRMRGWW